LQQRQSAAAREQFAAAEKLAPNDAKLHLNLALTYLADRKWKEAKQQIDTALQLHPQYPEALRALTELLTAQKQGGQALARTAEYLQRYPADASGHVLLGELQARGRRYDSAKREFQRAIELDPKLLLAHVQLASLQTSLGDWDAAIAQYNQALALRPKSAYIHGLLGSLYLNKKSPELARKYFEQALSIDPGFAAVANNLAWIAAQTGGDMNLALSLAQKGKELMPDSPDITDTLAWIQYKKGLYEAAIPLMRECVAKSPSMPAYRYHFGMALLASGRKTEAKPHLEAALRLHLPEEDARDARQALEKLR
jgi:tetratricopeptide (TPR) repeat protein